MSAVGQPATMLLFRAGGRLCALPVTAIAETLRPLPVQPSPAAPDFVAGVTMLRGVPAPVIDVAKLLGSASDTWGRYLSLRAGQRSVALAVEEVLGLRDLLPEQFHALPPLLDDASQSVGRLGELDGELLLVLREAHLLPESIWEAVPS